MKSASYDARKGGRRTATSPERMGDPRPPEPVKPFVAVLSADAAALADARTAVEDALGPIDVCSGNWPFDATSYYAAEMGSGLRRQFWACASLASPECLAEWKLATNAIETRLAGSGGRRVNLDPGYVGFPHVALASTKPFMHRLYLRDGICGEVTLVWQAGRFVELPWTFPEYRTARVQAFLMEVRDAYRAVARPVPA